MKKILFLIALATSNRTVDARLGQGAVATKLNISTKES